MAGWGSVKALPLFLLALTGFGIFWGVREELYADLGFQVQQIVVVPPGALSDTARQRLDQRYLRQNLFKISPQRVRQFVQEDPLIHGVQVTRDFPRTLRIEINERKPFAEVELQSQGTYVRVSEDGTVLHQGPERDKNLLWVKAPEARHVKVKAGTGLPLPGLKEGLALARSFWNHPFGRSEKIEWLRIDHLGNVALSLREGPEIRFGSQPLKKFHRLETLGPLLERPERDQIVYIELQYQDLIVKKES